MIRKELKLTLTATEVEQLPPMLGRLARLELFSDDSYVYLLVWISDTITIWVRNMSKDVLLPAAGDIPLIECPVDHIALAKCLEEALI